MYTYNIDWTLFEDKRSVGQGRGGGGGGFNTFFG